MFRWQALIFNEQTNLLLTCIHLLFYWIVQSHMNGGTNSLCLRISNFKMDCTCEIVGTQFDAIVGRIIDCQLKLKMALERQIVPQIHNGQ